MYRGKEYERLSDFCTRTLNQLPNAEQMNKLSPPTTEMLESYHQYVQINKVEPLMDEKRHRLSGKPVTAEAVLRYVFNITSLNTAYVKFYLNFLYLGLDL